MKGSQKFSKLFEDDAPPAAVPVKSRGRSKMRHDRRNEMLLDRYYYYARILRMRQPDVLSKIDAEFCIAPITTTEIVDKKESYIASLKTQNTSTKDLKAKWDHLNWSN